MKRTMLKQGRELHIHSDRFSVYSGDFRLFTFYVETHVNTVDKVDADEDIRLDFCGENEYVWLAKSSLWDKKEYRLKSTPDGSWTFSVKVTGQGAIGNIDYFRGQAGSIGSAYSVAHYTCANCQDNDLNASTFQMNVEPAVLDSYRAAPPPMVFPFDNDYNADFTGIGIVAPAGENNYQRFELHAPSNGWNENGCYFTVPMDGYTLCDGQWTAPVIWGGFAQDVYGIYTNYSLWQYAHLNFAKNIHEKDAPSWWKLPIFCGWGQQGKLAEITPGVKTKDLATQEVYQSFCDRLDELELPIGSVFIDDRWQTAYGTLEVDTRKWPDMRGFTDAQHEKGRHVILWLKCWDKEGLPDDECIYVDGESVYADPTNPKYLDRLKKSVYTLLSADEGCMNCDGFKIDFMDLFPRRPGVICHEKGVFGLEMMKRLFGAIYRFSKEVKPDALINMSSLHPYFSDVCDMFRIHDYGAELRNPVGVMKFRTSLAKAVHPGILVDTDGFCANTKAHQLKLMLEASKLGVPDMYFFPDGFTEREWGKIRECYCDYIKNSN